jgi:hypothetical protein
MATRAHPLGIALADDLHKIFGDRLQSLVAYGPRIEGDGDAPLTCLVLVSTLTLGDLEAMARRAGDWQRQEIATPLVLPADEFGRSLDAFPLEYGEIIRAHQVLFGHSPFDTAAIDPADLRRACETQVKSHLVHLRQGFIQTRGKAPAIAALVVASAAPFAALLRNVARLNGVKTGDRMQVTQEGAKLAGLDGRIVSDILALERNASVPTTDPARLFPPYLALVEQLASVIDAWHAA